jgi:uncharacterized coiled-coil protein SlyX
MTKVQKLFDMDYEVRIAELEAEVAKRDYELAVINLEQAKQREKKRKMETEIAQKEAEVNSRKNN